MNEMEQQNPSDFQEGALRKRDRSCLGRYKCTAVVAVMVILLGTLCAYILSVVIGNSVPEDPSENELPDYEFPFVTRAQWHARRPKQADRLTTPVPYVVIHHSFTPGACYTDDQCGQAMRSMQDFHMENRGWWDIGYNFAVGSNGVAYEGRGWKTIGAHAKYFNSVSIGICLIGDWRFNLPPTEQMKIVQQLIDAGVSLGFINPNYKLVGHRQVRATECPGDALFKEIMTWDHFSPYPSSVHDLVNVKELSASVRENLRNMTANSNETKSVPVLLHKLVN